MNQRRLSSCLAHHHHQTPATDMQIQLRCKLPVLWLKHAGPLAPHTPHPTPYTLTLPVIKGIL